MAMLRSPSTPALSRGPIPLAEPRRAPAWAAWIGASGWLWLVGLTVVLAVLAQRRVEVIRAQAWTVRGPPCPILSEPAYRRVARPAGQAFFYHDAHFARADGMANCVEIAENGGRGPAHGPTCQFNSPTTLVIDTPRGRFRYATGLSPATVTVLRDQPRCVLGGGIGTLWPG
jgi:hypothetical protein